MTRDKEYEGEYTEVDFWCAREGDWYVLYLRGEVIDRRYDRFSPITHVGIPFSTGRSPRYPRTWDSILVRWRYGVRGHADWYTKEPTRGTFRYKNDIIIKVDNPRTEENADDNEPQHLDR